MNISSDIAAVCDNIIFLKDGSAQLIVKFSGYHTNFDSDMELNQHFDSLRHLFLDMPRDIQCFVVPVRQSIDDVQEAYLHSVHGNLRAVANEHVKDIFQHLQNSDELGHDENKQALYVGIEIDKEEMKVEEEEESVSLGDIYHRVVEWLRSKVYRVKDREPETYLTEMKLRKAFRGRERIWNTLNSIPLSFNDVDCTEMEKILPWILHVGLRVPPNQKSWDEQFTPVFGKNGEVIARIQNQEDVLNLQMTGIENAKDRKHLILHQADGKGVNHKTYVAFLHTVKMPKVTFFPDTRWLENLNNLSFGVGVSLKMTYQSAEKRLSRLRRGKANLEDQAKHLSQYEEEAGSNVYDGIALADEVITSIESERDPSFLMSGIFAVYASDYNTLQTRITETINEYASVGIKLQNTYGLQLRSLLECLPGSQHYVTEFMQDVDANVLTSSFFGSRQELGDDIGFYESRSMTGKPIYKLPGKAAAAKNKEQSLVQVYSGKTGAGKSMAADHYIYESTLYGAKTLLLDPKGERKRKGKWDEKLRELGTELNFITFSNRDEDAGKLDPFLLFDDRQTARDVSQEVINYMLDINIREDAEKNVMVSDALGRVMELDHPSIRFTKDELENIAADTEKYDEEERKTARRLARILKHLEDTSLARLIFAEQTNYDYTLNFSNQLNVLEVENLQLPDKNKNPKDYTQDNIISVAILFSLTAYMMRFMRMFPNELTQIAIDEAWNFFQNAAGVQLLDKLFREGRSELSPIILMTQNMKDIPEEIRGQIGTAYCFRTDNEEEIKAIQSFMRIKDDLSTIMPNLSSGFCLHRDLEHRVGIVEVRILQDHLFDAFDTSSDIQELVKA